ncbi:hypothetical protein DFP72DRAFT_868167 [Ephemerocybe angulata]|uniref:Secreted protein n=1 Tax=Ephemerocybe angulata TaxID=980116 RepID=A0A8H6IJQ8_9AGAR|nr:hypothetical protein DFP72DRAFT_868167 [Tulosesus angulatus]
MSNPPVIVLAEWSSVLGLECLVHCAEWDPCSRACASGDNDVHITGMRFYPAYLCTVFFNSGSPPLLLDLVLHAESSSVFMIS